MICIPFICRSCPVLQKVWQAPPYQRGWPELRELGMPTLGLWQRYFIKTFWQRPKEIVTQRKKMLQAWNRIIWQQDLMTIQNLTINAFLIVSKIKLNECHFCLQFFRAESQVCFTGSARSLDTTEQQFQNISGFSCSNVNHQRYKSSCEHETTVIF